MKVRLTHVISAVMAVACLASFQAQSATTYRVTSLGTLGGGETAAYALNNLGMVAGKSVNADGITHAFVWSAGQGMLDLGDLSGGMGYSEAHGINDLGQVVGLTTVEGDNVHAFIWDQANGMRDLGTLPGYGNYTNALAINNSGQVVGATSSVGFYPPFLYDQAHGMQDVRTLVGSNNFSEAIDINSQGGVLGSAYLPQGGAQAVVWHNNQVIGVGDLPGGNNLSAGFRINDLGDVVGWSSTYIPGMRFQADHAFLWRDGAILDLGDLTGGNDSSVAYGVNNKRQVVGKGNLGLPYGGDMDRAFLWSETDGMLVLDSLVDPSDVYHGIGFGNARDINDFGQIIAAGIGGEYSAVLLTPVPEPKAYVMMLLGLGLVAFQARSRSIQFGCSICRFRPKRDLGLVE